MKVFQNIELKPLNSFGVEACAARLVEWETAAELSGSKLIALLADEPWMALGGGNNILFTHDYAGTLLRSAAKNVEVISETSEKVAVRAEAGVNWDDFVKWCVDRRLWGAENLSGIPGTAGAAPIQNIGAYGAEVKDIISSVECHSTETRNTLILAAEHCGFGYRDSIFKRELKGKAIVTAVNFILNKVPSPNIRYAALAEKVSATGSGEPTLENISRAVIAIRNSKLPDPKVTGNAGSFFKNPVVDIAIAQRLAAQYPDMPLYPAGDVTPIGDGEVKIACAARIKLAAGWLIEQAGWKGRTEGRVGIHPHQALIIINLGGATGREIVDLARKVQHDVKATFGVDLETEVNII